MPSVPHLHQGRRISAGVTVVTAYLRPKDGAQERLAELRPDLEREFSAQMPGFISATLLKVDGTDEWRDIVVLSDPAGVEARLESPAYDEWSSLVDVTSHDVSTTISHFSADDRPSKLHASPPQLTPTPLSPR